MKEIFAEYAKPPQVIHVFIGKVKVLNILDDLFKPGADRVTVVARVLAEEHVENDLLVLALRIISLHHSQFI